MRQLYLLLFYFLFFASAHLSAQSNPCDMTIVVAQATGGTMTCADPTVDLTGQLQAYPLTYQWTGPNGFSSDQRVAQTVRKGIYQLVVTTANGCTASTTVTVNDACTTASSDIIPPECPYDGEIMPAESCDQACVFKCLNGTYYGSTGGFYEDIKPNDWCGTIENDQWLAFMALTTSITLTAIPHNCQTGMGIQMAIYEDCYGLPLDCDGGDQNTFNIPTVTANNLILGKAYYIVIDGYAGDICDFTLEALPNFPLDILCTTVPSDSCPPGIDCTVFDTISVNGPSHLCPGSTASYGISVPSNAVVSGYEWTGPPGTLINGNPVPFVTYPPSGKNPQITFAGQSGTICVRTLTYFYPPSVPLCIDIGFDPASETILPEVFMCYEDAPFVSAFGDEIYTSGDYVWLLPASTGCDSIVRQKVTFQQPTLLYINRYVCEGDCYNLCGNDYCSTGIYYETCGTQTGCKDITLNLQVLPAPVAEIIGSNTLDCGQASLILNSAPSGGGNKQWLHVETGSITTGNTRVITQPGTYILTSTVSLPGSSCQVSDTIVITLTDNSLDVSPSATPIVSCLAPSAIVSASSSLANVTFTWSGPAGFTATGPSHTVTNSGTYTVTATNPATGCSKTVTVIVENQTIIPVVTAQDDTLTCIHTIPDLVATSTATNPSYQWTPLSNGQYQVVVTDGITGCTASDIALITTNTTAPVLQLEGTIIDCSATSFSLSAQSNISDAQYAWSGPLNYVYAGANAAVTQPGTYFATVTDPATGCTSSSSVAAIDNNDPPNLQIMQTPPACGDSVLHISASSNTPGTQIFWTGLDGFVDSNAVLTVPIAPLYVAHAIGLNACERIINLFPIAPPLIPTVAAIGDSITCEHPVAQLTATSTSPGATFAWTGPHGFTAQIANPVADSAGIYTVTVLSTDGCTASAQAIVAGDCMVDIATLTDNNQELKIFPVPGTGVIWVEMSQAWQSEVLKIDLYDAAGKLVWTIANEQPQPIKRFDLRHLPVGTYAIQIQNKERLWHGTIVLIR